MKKKTTEEELREIEARLSEIDEERLLLVERKDALIAKKYAHLVGKFIRRSVFEYHKVVAITGINNLAEPRVTYEAIGFMNCPGSGERTLSITSRLFAGIMVGNIERDTVTQEEFLKEFNVCISDASKLFNGWG